MKAFAIIVISDALAIPVLAIIASAPISMASAAWLGTPIPASTITGRSISSIMILIKSLVARPLFDPIGLPRGMIEETIPYAKVYSKDLKINWENLNEISKKTDIFIEAFDKKEMKSLVFDYFLGKKDKKLIIGSGLSGLGDLEDIRIKKIDNVTMIGDFRTSPEMGLYLPYVGVVASLEALYAIKIITGEANGK